MERLINEEFRKLLLEYFDSGNRFTFKQSFEGIDQLSFYNYHAFSDEYDSEVINGVITVNWSLTVNLKEWGVKGFDINVSEIEGIFTLNLLDKQTDEIIQQSEKNINDFNWKFIVNKDDVTLDGSVFISELIFDFKSQTCTVEFT